MNDQQYYEKLFNEFKASIFKCIAPFNYDYDDDNAFILARAVFSGWVLASETHDFKISMLKTALKEKMTEAEYNELTETIKKDKFLSKDYVKKQALLNFFVINTMKENNVLSDDVGTDKLVDAVLLSVYDSMFNVDLQAYFDEHQEAYKESPLGTVTLAKLGMKLDQIKAMNALFDEGFLKILGENFDIEEIRELDLNNEDHKKQADELENLLAKRARVRRIIEDIGGVLQLRDILMSHDNVGDMDAESTLISASLSKTSYPLSEIRLLISELVDLQLNNPLSLSLEALQGSMQSIEKGSEIALKQRNSRDFRAVVGVEVDGQRIVYSYDDLKFMYDFSRIIHKTNLQESISPINTLAV